MARKTPHEVNIDFIELGINVEKRIVSFTNEHIDNDKVGEAVRAIQLMIFNNAEDPIDVYISSPGGCPYASMGFYSFLKSLPVTVRTHNMGLCASGATIIYLAGDERNMLNFSSFMFHTVSGGAFGKFSPTIKDEAEEMSKIFDDLIAIYSKETNQKESWWKKKIEHHDFYVRKDSALELGIVHNIVKDHGTSVD